MEACCTTLWSLAVSPQCRSTILSHTQTTTTNHNNNDEDRIINIPQAICNTIMAHITNENLLQKACGALRTLLVYHTSIQQELFSGKQSVGHVLANECDGVGVLLVVLQANISSKDVAIEAWGVLTNLMTFSSGSSSTSSLPSSSSAKRNNSSRRKKNKCIVNLTQHSQQLLLVIRCTMEYHGQSSSVQESVLKFLVNVCSTSTSSLSSSSRTNSNINNEILTSGGKNSDILPALIMKAAERFPKTCSERARKILRCL
mmetsp:Transcript_9781/g.11238  ORF Transcript_9781/g.11238 Transcript_9781/m.11238 type:complete len:258 (-) Transcript_9781:79-852(-)